MTDNKPPAKSGLAEDGYSKLQNLNEGYLRKGGINPTDSQVQTRPPAPAPMKPAPSPPTGDKK